MAAANALFYVSSNGIMQFTRDEENAIRMIITISGVGMLARYILSAAIILGFMIAIIHKLILRKKSIKTHFEWPLLKPNEMFQLTNRI